MENNNKGIALITTLVLGLVALVFISALLYLILYSTKSSQNVKIYTNALEVAKGTASYIMNLSLSNSIACKTTDCQKCVEDNDCSSCEIDYKNCEIDVSAINAKVADYSVKAYLLTKAVPEPDVSIYSFKVITEGTKSDQKAEIDFVYKIKPKN